MRDVAIVYDGGIRDNGSPFYARAALAQVLGIDPNWYTQDPSANLGGIALGHDFYLHCDDGRDDLGVENIPHPWGYWIVDSHLGPDVRIAKAKQADMVWCAQKPFVEVLASHGIKAKWLPLACEPLVHRTAAELGSPPPDLDLAFVGHIQSPESTNRLQFLHELFGAFPNSWYAYGHFHEEMARVYHRARLGVNHAVRDDLNMRFFELASMGVPQLADTRMVGLRDLGFRAWEHYVPYSSPQSMPAKEMAKNALEFHGLELSLMAQRALLKVRESHTYYHRLCTILEDIDTYLRGDTPCTTVDGASQP